MDFTIMGADSKDFVEETLGKIKVLEDTFSIIKETVRKYEKQIEEYENNKENNEKRIEAYEKNKEEYEKKVKEYEKNKENNEKRIEAYEKNKEVYEKKIKEYEIKNKDYLNSVQQLQTELEQQKNKAALYGKSLANVEATYKEQKQKLANAEQKIKELQGSTQTITQPQGPLRIQVIKRNPLQTSNPPQSKIPKVSQNETYSGRYVDWTLNHEQYTAGKCYISCRLLEVSVIEAINTGLMVDSSISTLYQVDRFHRFPGNGRYFYISLITLASINCEDLTNFNCSINVLSQSAIKILVAYLCKESRSGKHFSSFNFSWSRDGFEAGNSLTWNSN